MRIQHNIAALNSYRNLSANNASVSGNLEKLSSGYKINRAGDDAAGLAISEKMRAQITGLETAQNNANDGISLVQTAEGALTEVHSMLNRMVELADQSANGTYDDNDRKQLQKEITSLNSEIDRISEGTNFNGINLLDGSLGAKAGSESVATIIDGAVADVTAQNGAKFTQTITVQAGTSGKTQTLNFKYLDKDGAAQDGSVTFTAGADIGATGTAAKTALQSFFGDGYTVTNTDGAVKIEAKETGADKTQIFAAEQLDDTTATTTAPAMSALTAGKDNTFTVDGTGMDVTNKNYLEVDGTKYQILTRGTQPEKDADKAIYVDQTTGNLNADSVKQIAAQLKDMGVEATADDTDLILSQATADSKAKGGLTLQIGDTSDNFNKLTVSIGDMSSQSLGIKDIDVSTQSGASTAVDKIKAAINTVSATRGDLGAIQNRLDHTIKNLSVTSENVTAAESRIRDVDMAKEMMNYTKNNILVQSSTAMLAQANQVPQGVLQLLQ